MQTSTDKKVHALKASQLQNYWRKICEDESRSQRRNEQLLRDLDRIDEHAARLAERTESLRMLKLEYEAYIEKTYPNWKDKVLQQRNQRMNQQNLHAPNEDTGISKSVKPRQERLHQQQLFMPRRDSFESAKQISKENSIGKQQNGSFKKHSEPVGIAETQPRHNRPHGQHLMSDQFYQNAAVLRNSDIAEAYDSSMAENCDQINVVDGATKKMEISNRKSSNDNYSIDPGLIENVQDNCSFDFATDVISNIRRASNHSFVMESNPCILNDQSSENSASSPVKFGNSKIMMQNFSQVPVSKMSESDTEKNILQHRQLSVPSGIMEESFSTKEEGSISEVSPRENEVHRSENKVHRNETQDDELDANHNGETVQYNENVSNSNDQKTSLKMLSLVPVPDVSLQGFFKMLEAVEDEVTFGNTFKFYFQLTTPPTSVVQEIIRTANGGNPLSHLNVESIAMVILEQLSCLSIASKNSCILTDHILSSLDGDVDNKVLRRQLDPSNHLLWDALYNHFIVLLRYEVLSPVEIADIFSPLLISENSRKQRQAVALITKLLEAVPPEDLHIPTPNSTSNFSFLSPRKPVETGLPSANINQLPNSVLARPLSEKVLEAAAVASPPQSPVHGLHLESSINKPSLRDPQGTLTQTAAYKQLLASTITSQTLNGLESDEDDEIEKNLSLHFSESRQAIQKDTQHDGVLSPRSPGGQKSPKIKLESDQVKKLSNNNVAKQETERKESFALKSASMKSGRSTIENIISQAQDDFDLDDDNNGMGLSKDLKVKHDDDDDDDFWA